jgi:hypothetical protein
MLTPSQPRTTLPSLIRLVITSRTMLLGTANPMPM